MSDGIHDANAGRYRGEDPETARAFRELQRQIQQLRMDPIYKIQSLLSVVGTYKAVGLFGRPTATGLAASPAHYGMGADGSNSTKLLINTLESPTNAAHALPIGSLIIGARRVHYNGEDTIFVSMPPNAFSGTNGGPKIDTDPGGGPGGDGGPGGGGGDGPGGDGPGGGGPGGGGGGGGGGDDGSCPLIKTVVIAGVGNPDYDTTWTCVWDGSQWTSAPGGHGLIVAVTRVTSVTYGGERWGVNTTNIYWSIDNDGACPPNGGYVRDAGSVPGAGVGSSATVS